MKLDLTHTYHLVQIARGDEWKTAFRTHYWHFEYNVMSFGLTNTPATFQWFIKDILQQFLDDFATAYLDDILIYTHSLEEHQEHVRKVFETLQNAGLYLDPQKCEFHIQSTNI